MPEPADPVPAAGASRGAPAGEATAGAGRFTNVVRFGAVDSTNRLALDLASQGVPEGLVVVAGEQLAGRGRRGRTWIAPVGSSLLCSVLFRPSLGPGSAHLLTAAVALAARQALGELAGLDVGLKWPNDLVVEPALADPADASATGSGGSAGKLGGVLAEWSAEGGLVVGIGINLDWPEGRPLPAGATSVSACCGQSPPPDQVLSRLLEALERRYRPLVGTAAPAPAAAAELAMERRQASATLGRQVRVERSGGEVLNGTAADIADDGRLVLRGADGHEVVLAEGDVVHLRPAPGRVSSA